MDREAWSAEVHGVPKSWTRLTDWTELNMEVLKWHSRVLCNDMEICYDVLSKKVEGRWKVKMSMGVSHSVFSYLTLRNPLGCTLLSSSVLGIFQARKLEWVAIPFFRRSSWPRDWTWVSCIAGRFFTIWATREAENKYNFLFFFLYTFTYT